MAAPAAAQEYLANLRGTVWNPDGSPAVGVPLTIVNESSGETRRVASDSGGRYAVAGLLPGTYRIEATDSGNAGFSIRTRVSVSQNHELDLKLGAVPITADADVRPTFIPIDGSPVPTTRLEGEFITRLPFDGRNFLDAVLLAPGTVPGLTAIASDGMSDLFTAYVIDGIYDVDPRTGAPAVRPQLDSIAELEVRPFSLHTSFGRTAGAQINVVTKSGTNEWRGGALGFFRSDSDRAQLGGFAGGPLARSGTFFFGNYEFADDDEELAGDGPSQVLSLRVDHILRGSARIAGRYSLDDGGFFDRRGQNAGLSVHAVRGSITSESRAALSRVAFGEESGLADFSGAETYQLGNVTTVPYAGHQFTGGAEWYGVRRGIHSDGLAASVWGLFLQDDFRALPSVSLTLGARFDRADARDSDETESGFSPRGGFAWTLDDQAQTIVRAGYGLLRNYTIFDASAPSVDAWSIGVQRLIGRARSVQAAYIATRGDDIAGEDATSRYDALQFGFEQRSDVGITTVTSYTVGKWTESFDQSSESVRSALDSRHRLSVAFAAGLPFGKDRRWFSDGIPAAILGDMEVTGVFTVQTGRPDFSPDGGASHRNLDGAILKNIPLGDRRTLQLRAETFNLTDRTAPTQRSRRYQVGGRLIF
jgi:hypothetical protein